jgi:hypothetical protein
MLSNYRPRLSIEISNEQYNALGRLIPWGVKSELFSAIIDDLIDLLEKEGEIVIAAVLTKRLKIKDLRSFERK